MDNQHLFSEFKELSAKEWKLLIQAELKGADYNQALVWESLEGIKVKPFYHPDEAQYLTIPNVPKKFHIAQSVFVDDESISNKIATDALEKGADIIIFEAKQSFDVDVLLQGFEQLKIQKIVFQFYFLSIEFIRSIRESYPSLPIEFSIDVLGNWIKTGNWFTNQTTDIEKVKEVSPLTKNVTIRADYFQNAGANLIQQIAYALAQSVEYLAILGKEYKGKIQFHFAVGSNFFFEIAKLRAFRYLWHEVKKATQAQSVDMELWCRPTWRNKTLYDFNVNILRTATEKFSAILGGADVVQTMPYDAFFKKSNAFSERIARNQLLLYKYENELSDISEVAKESYFIEALTIEMTEKALELVQNIEKNGGFIHQIKEGIIQKKIKESAQKEQKLVDEQKLILIGTNRFPLVNEKMKDQIEIVPFAKIRKNKTHVMPIVATRLSEKMEQERLEQEI